mmetsp:Transcript_12073/g.23295  ORF Transcript_12073/g.23295 Transcript_12073/m.23295 type:complete len:81 (+) Transcript_12073:281-523(+)
MTFGMKRFTIRTVAPNLAPLSPFLDLPLFKVNGTSQVGLLLVSVAARGGGADNPAISPMSIYVEGPGKGRKAGFFPSVQN